MSGNFPGVIFPEHQREDEEIDHDATEVSRPVAVRFSAGVFRFVGYPRFIVVFCNGRSRFAVLTNSFATVLQLCYSWSGGTMNGSTTCLDKK